MATEFSYIQFILEQLQGEEATYKKMFGEYMVYVNDKPLLLVCDNTVYVKMLPQISALMSNASTGVPYAGSKPHYILDIENRELTSQAIAILEPITPLPKKRKKQ